MITTDKKMLSLWADVQLHALNPDPSKVILLRGEEAQRGALEAMAASAERAGAENVKVLAIDPQEMSDLIRKGDPASIATFHAKTEAAFQEIIDHGGAVARLAGTADLDLRSRLQTEYPDHYKMWDKAETKASRVYRDNISSTGAHPWLVGYAPAEGDAASMFPELPIDQAIERAWEVNFKINMCDKADPVAEWEKLDEVLHARCRMLDAFGIEYVEVSGHGSNARIGFSELAQYLGGSKTTLGGIRVNNNRPSFEVWTAPHKDRVDGVLRATVPFLCDGVKVENLEVTFKDGLVESFKATAGQEHFGQHIANRGANQLGEFALVDGNNPISGAPMTWQTLVEENRSCHVALGNAYKTNIKGWQELSEAQLNHHGVNSSDKHTDFMWSGPETSVVAITRDGQRIPIIENGLFAAPFA